MSLIVSQHFNSQYFKLIYYSGINNNDILKLNLLLHTTIKIKLPKKKRFPLPIYSVLNVSFTIITPRITVTVPLVTLNVVRTIFRIIARNHHRIPPNVGTPRSGHTLNVQPHIKPVYKNLISTRTKYKAVKYNNRFTPIPS